MKKIKLLFVIGTRPEAIKLAPVIHECLNKFSIKVCLTAQHRGLLDEMITFFEIPIESDLNLMQHNQSLLSLSSKAILKLEALFYKEQPDYVIVQGDTSTAFIAAYTATMLNIKVAHIEAGLRSGDKTAPFPEEINRLLVSKLATLHFAPTQAAKNNLIDENIINNVYVVGNTVLDALLYTKKKVNQDTNKYRNQFEKLGLSQDKKTILVTTHRRENFGLPILNICSAIIQLATKHPEVQFLVTVHPNPNVKDVLTQKLSNKKGIILSAPLSYPSLIWLLQRVECVISDSGGIQEEAPTFSKHVFVLRDTTERQEGIESGVSTLVGTETDKIFNNVDSFLKKKQNTTYHNPYGDGLSSLRIAKIISNEASK